MAVYEIVTRQAGLKSKDPHVTARRMEEHRATGRVLREEIHRRPGGLELHTIVVRWTGRGISVYRVLDCTPLAGGTADRWTVEELHAGL